MSSETDKAYAAGIIDGEGSICLDMVSGTGVGVPKVYVKMTKSLVPEWLKATFGGSLVPTKNTYGPVFSWYLSGSDCAPFLELVKPYIKLKAQQLEILLLFCSTLRPQGGFMLPRGLDEKTLLLRLQLAECLSGLNAKQQKSKIQEVIPVKERAS